MVGLGNVGIAIAKKFQALNASRILYTGHKIKSEGEEYHQPVSTSRIKLR